MDKGGGILLKNLGIVKIKKQDNIWKIEERERK